MAAGLMCALFAGEASAHPMPNSVITISLADAGARFDVAIPLPDLRLALPASIPATADLRLEPQRTALIDYLTAHTALESTGAVVRPVVESVAVDESVDENVGRYQELRVRMFAAAGPRFAPREFSLHYDAVIHQVPTHYTMVRVVQDSHAARLAAQPDDNARVIRFDFARNEVAALPIVSAAPSPWRERRAAAMIGAALLIGLVSLRRRA